MTESGVAKLGREPRNKLQDYPRGEILPPTSEDLRKLGCRARVPRSLVLAALAFLGRQADNTEKGPRLGCVCCFSKAGRYYHMAFFYPNTVASFSCGGCGGCCGVDSALISGFSASVGGLFRGIDRRSRTRIVRCKFHSTDPRATNLPSSSSCYWCCIAAGDVLGAVRRGARKGGRFLRAGFGLGFHRPHPHPGYPPKVLLANLA